MSVVRKILFVLTLLFAVCTLFAQREKLPPIDYTNPANWAVYTPAAEATKPFDVFYIYPTLVASQEFPLMQWDAATREKVIPFSKAQLKGFEKIANLYVPYVRQLEMGRIMEELTEQILLTGKKKIAPRPLTESSAAGIMDSMEAFHYYLTHLNHGRPYILLGHSQGAMDLTFVLVNNGNIRVESGFVAAYLIGMPFKEQLKLPFAKGESDVGVIVSWNTQTAEAKNNLFAGKGAYCINPLNWKTDATPATAEQNPGAMFYDFREKTFTRFPRYCGAVIDPEKGALIVDPVRRDPEWAHTDLLGKGVRHMSDIWFFYDALVENAQKRVQAWETRKQQQKK